MYIRNKNIFLMLVLTLFSCNKQLTCNNNISYKTVTEIKTTPVKNQGQSNLCWLYAMLGTIESEHIMQGDSVEISTTYLARNIITEKAQICYFSNNKKSISLRGMGCTAIHYLERYGAEPYTSFKDPSDINYNILCKKVEHLAFTMSRQGSGLSSFNEKLNDLLDQSTGFTPGQFVYMLGAQYTPKEFAHSICYPGEYLSLTSFSHHPFHKSFVLEVPDNEMHDYFYNLPIEELMKHIHDAVKAGHPVCWEGDVTNDDFHEGFVSLSNHHPITQRYRQRLFETLKTSDNHALEITGIVNKNGKEYYKCKNSYGTEWGDKGFVYLSPDYIAINTIAVFMSKEAYKRGVINNHNQ